MKKLFFLPLAFAAFTFVSCSEEPLNMECDIEKAYIHLDNPAELFYDGQYGDTLAYAELNGAVPTANDSIGFTVRTDCQPGQYPLYLTVTPGAKTYVLGEDGSKQLFKNGQLIDFANDKVTRLQVVSEDGEWSRTYRISMTHRVATSGDMFFDFNDSYFLRSSNKAQYYVWGVTDVNAVNGLFLGEPEWKNGNPGYALSKSSAPADQYPTSPVFGGGPDGSDCIKLETMTTGSLGAMARIYIAAGSLFNGSFDPKSALKSRAAAKEATRFGTPFDHKPVRFSVDMRYEPAPEYKDEDLVKHDDIIDEPDAYCVIYRNVDDEGNAFILDGNNVVTSKYIVGMARLPHNYTYDAENNGHPMYRHDLPGNTPIHGLTNQWKHVEMNVEYFSELDPEILANYGYSMAIGFTCSWQGGDFRGALGSKLYLDNIRLECE